jgi:lysophospholipase L1-like esterase
VTRNPAALVVRGSLTFGLALGALSLAALASAQAAQATTAPAAQAPAPAPAAPAFPGQYAPPPEGRKFPAWPKGCARFEGEEKMSCLDVVASDFAGFYRYAEANAALAAPKPNEDRVVFFGDSITDNWSKPDYGGFFPGKPYVNRGIGGQTTAQMLLRLRADVLELGPKAVVILAGTNDVAGNAGPVTPAQIKDNLASMAELAKAHGVRVVLASLLPVSDDKKDANGQPVTRTRQRPPATLRELNAWLSSYAKQNGHVYLDYFSATADAGGLLRAELNDDGLHPNAKGYAVMAPLAEKAIAEALRKPAPKR